MRTILYVTLGLMLTAGSAMAQRGGGGARGGGGGGFRGGGGFGGGFHGGGGYGGGFHGGSGFVGNRGGFGGYGFRGGYGYGFRGYGYRYPGWYGGYWGGWGLGVGYWPYYDSGYYDPGYYSYPYSTYPAYGYSPNYNSSPNVTVVYPAQQPASNAVYYTDRVQPVSHAYDQYGQEVRSSAPVAAPGAGLAPAASGSPIYLIALHDGVIRAAASYWVNGSMLHYVTVDHTEKTVPLAEVDRGLSAQLNRERHVQFSLP
jgi:hypothetical protein